MTCRAFTEVKTRPPSQLLAHKMLNGRRVRDGGRVEREEAEADTFFFTVWSAP